MNKQPKSGGRFVEFLTGKGFYIILFLCIAAIGVSGYMLFFSKPDDTLGYLDQPVNANADLNRPVVPEWPAAVTPAPTLPPEPKEDDVPVVAVTAIPKPSPKPDDKKATTTSASTSTSTSEKKTSKSGEKTVYVWPVKGDAVAVFSDNDLVYNKTMGDWRVHLGLDIAAELGTQVCAAADGTVIDVYEDVFWGTTVVIDHGNGITGQYSNLMKKPVVSAGNTVKAGQVIGGVGMTAEAERREVNHLHFAMNLNNKPVDPKLYLPTQ